MELKFIDQTKNLFDSKKDIAEASDWTCTWIAAAMKGLQIKLLDTKGTSQFADYILIATFQNPTQANAMSQQIVKTLKQFNVELRALEGQNDSDWILIDLHDVVVHLFSESARALYALDELLVAHKQVVIPQEFYTSSYDNKLDDVAISNKSAEDFKNYL